MVYAVWLHAAQMQALSGGAGRWRGGLATEMAFRVFAPDSRITARNRDRSFFRPWGVLGGHAAGLSDMVVNPGTEGERRLGNIDTAVSAIGRGAMDFIEKPFSDQRLLDVIAAAIRESRRRLHAVQRQQQAGTRLAHLSQRELEVARKVALGLPNKVVARELAISEKTVQAHRRNVMDKAGVSSAAELTRMLMIADPGFAAEPEASKS